MNANTGKKIRKGYGWALCACLLVTAGLLIGSAADIYFSAKGDGAIYTPNAVSARFSQIAWFVYFTLAAVVGGGILPFFFPEERPKLRARINENAVLARLKNRMELDGKEGEEELLSTTKARKVLKTVCCVLFALCGVAVAAFVAQAKTEWKSENAAAVSVAAVSAVALAVGVFFALFDRALLSRQIAVCKQILANAAKRGSATGSVRAEKANSAQKKAQNKTVLVCRIAFFTAGVALTVFGVFNNGAYETFVKAVQICTQCIGLG